MSELYPAAYIRLDLFPANIISSAHGSGVISNARIIITDAHVYIFTDTTSGPALFYSAVVVSYSGDNKIGYTVTTEDDETLEFRRSNGCGCGSRLRGYRPFPGVPFNAR